MGDDEVGAVVSRLNDLISRWSDPASPRKVRPKDVIPDSTNREGTLVSIEHAHGIAMNILKEGFSESHEVPVVVRNDAGAMLRGGDAYKRWRRFVRDNAAVMPPLRSKRSWARSGVAYTTLGSSHLNLALRLVETEMSLMAKGRAVPVWAMSALEGKLTEADAEMELLRREVAQLEETFEARVAAEKLR